MSYYTIIVYRNTMKHEFIEYTNNITYKKKVQEKWPNKYVRQLENIILDHEQEIIDFIVNIY